MELKKLTEVLAVPADKVSVEHRKFFEAVANKCKQFSEVLLSLTKEKLETHQRRVFISELSELKDNGYVTDLNLIQEMDKRIKELKMEDEHEGQRPVSHK